MLSKTAEGLQYGYGVFETLLIKNGKAVDLQAHFDRLNQSLRALKMPQITEATFESAIVNEHALNQNAVVKITCLLDHDTTRLISTSRENKYVPNDYQAGFRVVQSKVRRHSENPIYLHKTTNFINNQLEMNSIRLNGFQEALHFNEKGYVTEGIYSNLFIVKDSCVYTPAIDNALLPGIQRNNVMESLKKLGIPCEIGYYSNETLLEADALFLTSAVLGLMPIRSYEQVQYNFENNETIEVLIRELIT